MMTPVWQDSVCIEVSVYVVRVVLYIYCILSYICFFTFNLQSKLQL